VGFETGQFPAARAGASKKIGRKRSTRIDRKKTIITVIGAILTVLIGYALIQFNISGSPGGRPTAANGEPEIDNAGGSPVSGEAGTALQPAPSGSATPSTSAASRNPNVGGPCKAFPAMPDANCTGWQHTGVQLRSCPNTITTANTTLDGCRFSGGLTIQASNVTITRSRVEGRVMATYLTNYSLRGLRLVDVEIDGGGRLDPTNQAAIGNDDYTCLRCHVHGTGRGANLGNNVTIQDSYLHDWVYSNGAHQTAIQTNGGSGFRIIHNNLVCNSGGPGCSSALSFYGDFAPVKDALVQNNLFNTNGAYCTYGGSVSGKPYPRGTYIRYIDNLFGKQFYKGCGTYGPVATFEYYEGNVWTGNRWQDGSGLVQPKSGT
jgi:hypothetical protein